MTQLAALLRGVNVGGRPLPMAQLAELFGTLGLEGVRTYIQSGNVVFAGRPSAALPRRLEQAIEDRFGLQTRVLVRTHAELAAAAAANPFPDAAANPTRLHVVFLEAAPARKALGALDADRSPGDSFAVAGREIFLSLPNGFGRSKLTLDYFERKLGVAGTARNWNTLLKLIELTEPRAAA